MKDPKENTSELTEQQKSELKWNGWVWTALWCSSTLCWHVSMDMDC